MTNRRPTRIHCEIDLARDGKQVGYLRVPHSVHRSAYGWLPVPIVSIRNGDGPRALLLAGNHGDEYEGQVALAKLVRALEPGAIRGRVVVMPMANFPAAMAGLRTSPLDEGNLNRTFPGDPDGSVTAMLAHFIEDVLLPQSDFMIDLHSGGSSLHYLPTGMIRVTADKALAARCRALLEAFAPPHAITISMGGEDRTSIAAGLRAGVVTMVTELGGSGTVSPDCLRHAEHGVRRALRHMGILQGGPGADEPPPLAPRWLSIGGDRAYLYAPEPGLFEPRVDLGEWVKSGQSAGAIHDPATPWRAPAEVTFRYDCYVLCKRVPGRVERGDCLFHLASAP
ncbi:MAG: deacylase [Alphaproteobacteria bacterium]|nr:deacylase [Alphaproteobacteria bacterium]